MLFNNLDDGKNCGVHIVQDALTVGRVADKADIVLPVATGHFTSCKTAVTN